VSESVVVCSLTQRESGGGAVICIYIYITHWFSFIERRGHIKLYQQKQCCLLLYLIEKIYQYEPKKSIYRPVFVLSLIFFLSLMGLKWITERTSYQCAFYSLISLIFAKRSFC